MKHRFEKLDKYILKEFEEINTDMINTGCGSFQYPFKKGLLAVTDFRFDDSINDLKQIEGITASIFSTSPCCSTPTKTVSLRKDWNRNLSNKLRQHLRDLKQWLAEKNIYIEKFVLIVESDIKFEKVHLTNITKVDSVAIWSYGILAIYKMEEKEEQ